MASLYYEHGIPVESHALFYELLSGDTTEPLSKVAQQRFIKIVSTSDTKFNNSRQMKRTRQVIWLQFKIENTHSTDTLSLWYYSGVHAAVSLYLKDNIPTYENAARYPLCCNDNQPMQVLQSALYISSSAGWQSKSLLALQVCSLIMGQVLCKKFA